MKTFSGLMALFLLGIGFVFPIQSANAQSNPICPDIVHSVQVGEPAQFTTEVDAIQVFQYIGQEFRFRWVDTPLEVTITAGPICEDGYWWWLISWGNSASGAVIEQNDNGFIYIQSASAVNTEINTESVSDCPSQDPPVQVGDTAYVIREDGVGILYPEGVIYESNWAEYWSRFEIIGGPVCDNGSRYWSIIWDGNPGWVIDEVYGEYVIHSSPPIDPELVGECPDRDKIEGLAIITDRSGVQLYTRSSSPEYYLIPFGDIIDLDTGQMCNNGLRTLSGTWDGVFGWIIDGNYTESWIQPYTEPRGFGADTYNVPCEGRDMDGCYHGAEPRIAKVIFINGVNNTVNDSEVNRIMVDGFFPSSIPVMGIYNGGLSDNYGNTRLLSAATRNLRDYLLNYGCDKTLVGHSQGGAIIADATRDLSSECLAELKIVTFGSPAVNFPVIDNIQHCSFALDLVTGSSRHEVGADIILDFMVWNPNWHLFVPVHHSFSEYLTYATQCGIRD